MVYSFRLRLDNTILQSKIEHIFKHLGLEGDRAKPTAIESKNTRYASSGVQKDEIKPVKKISSKSRKTSKSKRQNFLSNSRELKLS